MKRARRYCCRARRSGFAGATSPRILRFMLPPSAERPGDLVVRDAEFQAKLLPEFLPLRRTRVFAGQPLADHLALGRGQLPLGVGASSLPERC